MPTHHVLCCCRLDKISARRDKINHRGSIGRTSECSPTLGFSIGVLELHWSIFKISLYLAIINIVRMIERKCLKSQAVDWKGKCTCSVHREILNRQSHIVLLDLKNLTSLTRSLKSHLGCEKVQIYDTTMCNDKDHRAKKSKGKKVGMWVGYDWISGNAEFRLKSHGRGSTNFLFNNVRTFFKRYCSASVLWERPISPTNLKLELLTSLPTKNLTRPKISSPDRPHYFTSSLDEIQTHQSWLLCILRTGIR